MEPVLIYTDNSRIEEEKDHLYDSVEFLQELYDKFKKIGITATLKEMADVIQRGTSNNRLNDFVSDKFLEQAGEPNFNGVPICRNKLKEMLAIPDLKEIGALLSEFPSRVNDRLSYVHGRINLMEIVDDQVCKVSNADAAIEKEFTYFTETERTALFAKELLTVRDALKAWEAAYINQFGMVNRFSHDQEVVPGIRYYNKEFVLDWKLIRQREAILS